MSVNDCRKVPENLPNKTEQSVSSFETDRKHEESKLTDNDVMNIPVDDTSEESIASYALNGNNFLKRLHAYNQQNNLIWHSLVWFIIQRSRTFILNRFDVEVRSVVSHLFHNWAKKQAFQEPKRLIDKVSIAYSATFLQLM